MPHHSLLATIGTTLLRQKGQLVLEQGEVSTSIYIVKSGLLKAYYLTPEGKELIKSFIQKGEFIGSLIACHLSEPSTFSLMCLEDCSLIRIPFNDLHAIMSSEPELSSQITNVLIDLAIKKERREFEFLCLPASERYALFKQRTPNLVARITQNDIARYLGITPVALSRIKRRENSEA